MPPEPMFVLRPGSNTETIVRWLERVCQACDSSLNPPAYIPIVAPQIGEVATLWPSEARIQLRWLGCRSYPISQAVAWLMHGMPRQWHAEARQRRRQERMAHKCTV